jgi:hypothetical protein
LFLFDHTFLHCLDEKTRSGWERAWFVRPEAQEKARSFVSGPSCAAESISAQRHPLVSAKPGIESQVTLNIGKLLACE